MKPTACILHTDGTNCDEETAYAFENAGGHSHLIHINQLRARSRSLRDFAVLVLPGGFSYGDDIAAGAVLAGELISFLRDQLLAFIEAGRLLLGICNGFQVLVRTGLLPYHTVGVPQAALTTNDSGRFECRWVRLSIAHDSPCIFTRDLAGQVIELPVAHGEGKFTAERELLCELHERSLAPLHYFVQQGAAARYPANPNGSLDGIAGMCDPTGRIFGLMPHPERFVEPEHHPNWRRRRRDKPHGLVLFENAVKFAIDL